MGGYQSRHHQRILGGREIVQFIPTPKKPKPAPYQKPKDKEAPQPARTPVKPVECSDCHRLSNLSADTQASSSCQEPNSPLINPVTEPDLLNPIIDVPSQIFIIKRKGIVYQVPLLGSPEGSSLLLRRNQDAARGHQFLQLSATDDIP